MGLIKAALNSASGVLGDQWKEYFYCEAMDNDTLVQKGIKKNEGRGFHRNSGTNVITDGSLIAVADGQCMMIVENGKVVDFCAEPGSIRMIQVRNQVFSPEVSGKAYGRRSTE